MGRKETNGITDHAPAYFTGGDVQVRRKLFQLTTKHNPDFSESDLDQLMKQGTIDYFSSATNKSPQNALEQNEADVMNSLYRQLMDAKGRMALGGLLGKKKEVRAQDVKLTPDDKKAIRNLTWTNYENPSKLKQLINRDYFPVESGKNENAWAYSNSLMEAGGQLDSVSDMLPSAEPMSVIQPMDMSVIQPMENGGGVSKRNWSPEMLEKMATKQAKSDISKHYHKRSEPIYDDKPVEEWRGHALPYDTTFTSDQPFDGGGMVDLFEDYENIPSNVQPILDKYGLEDNDYRVLEEMKRELEAQGYTFDYGLDAEPYGLRPKNVPLNQLKGYEEFGEGGRVREIANKLVYQDKNNRTTTIGIVNPKGKSVIVFPFSLDKNDYPAMVEQWASENGYTTHYDKGAKTRFGGGGSLRQEAKNKWLTVMKEFRGGDLHHGTTGDVVTDDKMAMAIAYSEAQKIDPNYGKFYNGGETKNDTKMEVNKDINKLLMINGQDRGKYSARDLKMILNYTYPHKVTDLVANKMYGLAIKHGFKPKNASVYAWNVGTGEILSYIPDTVYCVHAEEKDLDKRMISSLVYGNDTVKVSSNPKMKDYDVAFGACSGLQSIVDRKKIAHIKRGGLMVSVVTKSLFTDAGESVASKLNQSFDLLEAYQLPDDVMRDFVLIALKKK